MDSTDWDQRYADRPLVWSAGPNQFVAEEVAGMAPARALDLACGEGRNALWLAEQGWYVTGTDFSPVAVDKARRLAEQRDLDARFEVADATAPAPGGPYDLVLVCYLQLPPDQRTAAHRRAANAVAPGGVLLIVGHDRDNLARGVGGPPDPELLLTTSAVRDDLRGTGLEVERAEQVTREVETDDGTTATAIDCLVRARRATDAA